MRVALLALVLSASAAAQETPPREFFGGEVDFFGEKKKKRETPTAPVWEGDKPPPAPVRELLEKPSPETARRYLEWQKHRLERLAQALKALEEAKAAEPKPDGKQILYFTRENCPYCREQDRLLGDLEVRRLNPGESPELWTRYGVDATPTLVVGGKVFRGVTARDVLEKARDGEERP